MSSQLASALKALAAASSTSSATASSSNSTVRHPSLLFTPTVAADTSVDSIYQLACSGLTQLSALQPSLQPFASSLFHPATLQLDRAAQKADVQAQLDKSITSFLTRLSPHFLHPAAAQALEWLVRRYEVQRYNSAVVVEQLLCWHQSDLFRRLLQLLKLPPNHFLLRVQTAGVTVDRRTIVSAARLDAAVWETIARTTRAQPHAAQLGLYVTVGVELLSSPVAGEQLLTASIPHLLHGLNLSAHHSLNYHAATLMLLVSVCEAHVLDSEVVRVLLTQLTAPLARDTSALSSTLHTLAAVTRSQRVERLEAEVVAALVHAKGTVAAMSELSTAREGELLLRTLLLSIARDLVDAAVSALSSALLSPQLTAAATPASTTAALTPLAASTSDASTTAVNTATRAAVSFADLLAALRQLLAALTPASVPLASALLTELFELTIAAAARTSSQLPVRLVTALREVVDSLEQSVGRAAVDEWVQQRKRGRSERETRRDLTDWTTSGHEDDAATVAAKRRKTQDSASTNTAEAEAEESEDEVAGERKERKRRRSRHRRTVLQLGQSEAAIGTHLLAHVTKGTRHAFTIARDGESGEDGAARLSVWQCVWSEEEDERKKGLSALQKLQRQASADKGGVEGERRVLFSAEQVESVVDDTLESDRPSLVQHLLSLTSLLLSLPSDTLSPILLRLLDRHTTTLAADAAGTGALGVAHRKEQQRASRSVLVAAFHFLSASFLPAHSHLLPAFLPFYLEHAMSHRSTARFNSTVRSHLSSLHRLSPLLLHLPSSVHSAQANGDSAEPSVEDDNQRLVELMAKNVIKDRSSAQLHALLDVMDGAHERGVLAAGLVLNLAFELRSEKAGAHANRKAKAAADDGELPHLRRFFTAVSRHLQRLSSTTGADSTAAQPPASYFSALPTALPAFLRYLLDRLILTLPPLSTTDTAAVEWSSTAAQLVHDVFVFLLSAPSTAAASPYNAHIAHLLARHLPSPALQLDLVVRCVLPPPPSSTPLLASVRAVQLLSSLLSAASAAPSVVLAAVPLQLCAMGHSSRAVRQAAVGLAQAMQAALQTADKADTKAHAAHQLLSVLLAERAECVSDPQVLPRLVGTFFTPHSPRSSLSTATTASFARWLLTSAATSAHRPLSAHLLAAMDRAPAVYVLDVADALLSGLLDGDKADDASVAVASHVLSHLTVDAMAASEHTADWFVALLTRALASPVAAVQRVVLAAVTPTLFTALPSAEQHSLFGALLNFQTSAELSALRDLASTTLRALPVSASVYVGSVEAAQAQLVRGDVDALSGLLDLVAATTALSHAHLLLRPLMAALSTLQQLDGSSDSAEYAKQRVLSCLLQLLPRLRAADVKGAHLDLHAIVACLTATQASSAAQQTRNTAIQLLSALAPLTPTAMADVVEQLVVQLTALPLTSTDSYSFALVQRAVEQILPPLLPAKQSNGDASSPLARRLLATLVRNVALDASTAAAVLELLCVTIRTVGSAYLHCVLQQLASRSVFDEAANSRLSERRAKRREEKKLKKQKGASSASTLHRDDELSAPFDHTAFAHSLLDQFAPLEQAREMAQMLHTTLSVAEDSGAAQQLSLQFGSDDERREWVVRLLQLVSSHLVHLPFVSSLLDLTDDEDSAMHAQYEPIFTSLFALQTSNAQQLHAKRAETTPQSHHRTVEAGLQSALSHLTNLLSVSSFVRLSTSLLTSADSSVPKQAMSLLQSKLTWLAAQHADRAATAQAGQQAAVELSVEKERDELSTLTTPLSALIQFEQSPEQAQQKERVAVAQLALACLQSLAIAVCAPVALGSQSDVAAAHLASRRQRLLAVFPAVLSHFDSSSAALSSSALLCAAALIDQLRVAVLAHLPSFLPRALAIAQQAATSATSKSSVALLSALTVVNVSIEQLPAFVSPYLPTILLLFMQPALHASAASADASALVDSSVASLIALLAPDTLLPHLTTAYKSAVKLGFSSLSFFFAALSQLVARLSPDLTRAHLKPLFRLYQLGFTARTVTSTALTGAELDALEALLVGGYMQLTLKLTEAQMKACLLRLLEWVGAVEAEVVPSGAAGKAAGTPRRSTAPMAAGGLERALVLFKVVEAMAERLKSIFVPYYAFVFDHAMAYLSEADNMQRAAQSGDADMDEDSESNSEADDGDKAGKPATSASLAVYSELVSRILSSLRTAMSHDTQHFFGKEHLDRLVPALAALLPAAYPMLGESYGAWVSASFTPLCVQLCLTLSHFHHWKPLHSALLAASRSPEAAVRLAVVECVLGLFDGLQSRYLVMLPETLPHVSEWLEDEDEEVERRVQRLVKSIEQLSGEKLDRYLEG